MSMHYDDEAESAAKQLNAYESAPLIYSTISVIQISCLTL